MYKFIFILFFAFSNFLFSNSDSIKIIEAFEMKKSPNTALMYSIIPGMGQYYVESYWKVPVFLGSAIGISSIMLYYHNNYIDYAEQVEEFINPYNKFTPNNNPSRNTGKTVRFAYNTNDFQILKRKREFYHDERDRMGFYLLAVYIVSAIDAYVGAHLYDFNVDENITMNLKPLQNGTLAINFTYKINP